MYATELGRQWGIGRDGKDNGLVMLVKPIKTNGPRTTFIAVGYGLEGPMPDATAKLIVENEMNPRFKKGEFFGGLKAGINVLVPLAVGEFNYEAYTAQTNSSSRKIPWMWLVIIGVVIFSKIGGARNYAKQNGISLWSAFMMENLLRGSFWWSGRRGGFDDFSSGGGGFGGGGF